MNKRLIIATLLGMTSLAVYRFYRVMERKRFIRERTRQLNFSLPVTPDSYEYTL